MNKKGTYTSESAVEMQSKIPATREELLALEQQLEREWWWLYGALNAAAELQANGVPVDRATFRNLQALSREIDRRRVELSVQIAERQGPARGRDGGGP